MKKIGLIGLGIMGKGMAGTLLAKGYSLHVWNRTAEKAKELVEQGAHFSSSPQEVAKESDVIITVLSNDQAVVDIMLDREGVLSGARSGQVVIDCSTVSPETSRKLYRAFSSKKIDFIDAPVTGSAQNARDGTLNFLVGGEQEVCSRVDDLFKAMGKDWIYLGESGNGSLAKLASNTMVAISLMALSEGLTMVRKGGINPQDFLRAISKGGANSRMAELKSSKILEGDLSTEFSAALMNKDLGLALDLSENLGVVVPTLSLAKQLFQITSNKGYGSYDVTSLYKIYEEWANN